MNDALYKRKENLEHNLHKITEDLKNETDSEIKKMIDKDLSICVAKLADIEKCLELDKSSKKTCFCGEPKRQNQNQCNICFEGFSKCKTSQERMDFILKRFKDVEESMK